MGYILPIPGEFSTQPNSAKIDMLVMVGDVGLINHAKFVFVMIVDGVQSYGGSNFALLHERLCRLCDCSTTVLHCVISLRLCFR